MDGKDSELGDVNPDTPAEAAEPPKTAPDVGDTPSTNQDDQPIDEIDKPDDSSAAEPDPFYGNPFDESVPPWLKQGSPRRTAVGIGLTLALVVVVAAVGWVFFKPDDKTARAETDIDDTVCGVVENVDDSAMIPLPTLDASPPPRQTVTFQTNYGDITVLLFGDLAPCGVSGFDYLAELGFYNGNNCYRITTQSQNPTVTLRCGDPSGTGHEGPGFRFQAEKVFSKEPALDALALINNKSGKAGSSFAFLRGQSVPTASISVIGQVISGFEVLDNIGGASGFEPYDGAPAVPVVINSITIHDGTATLPPTNPSPGDSISPDDDPSGDETPTDNDTPSPTASSPGFID